ncbi:MAG: M1 family metallopeptidase [Bacteroidota bacterium]
MLRNIMLLACIALLSGMHIQAQESGLPIADVYKQAIEKGSRTKDGKPGPKYFQNRSDYQIKARLEPSSRTLSGTVQIQYQNNSPDALDQIVLRLYQDMYKRGFDSDDQIAEEDQTDGVEISRVVLNGKSLGLEAGNSPVSRKGTNMFIKLEEALQSRGKLNLEIDWSFHIPSKTHVRMGEYGEGSYFIAYWFPQVAVYDDLFGWDVLDYTGTQEFYNDFGDFEVEISIPDDYVIWATGVLQNAEDLLTKDYYQKYQQAFTSDEVIHIVGKEDYEAGRQITQKGMDGYNSWIFKADFVPDFAFAAANFYHWDAASSVVDESGRRVYVDACYKPQAKDFPEVAGYARDIIHDLSMRSPGVAYPYPKMTIYQGDFGGGGMEYPMMVNDASTFSPGFAFSLTYHEIAHTYFPFYMGINERRYAWMDEGWASFFPEDMMVSRGFSRKPMGMNIQGFTSFAGGANAKPLMAESVDLQGMSYGVNSYFHPATAYYLLRDLLGEELFLKTLRGYMNRWNGKHPNPYDFFYSFNDLSGQNLDWFWKPWFFETGRPDLKLNVKSVKKKKMHVVVENVGDLPLPIYLTVRFADNTTEVIRETAAIWKDGEKRFTINQKFDKKIKSIKLGENWIPDKTSKNNSYKVPKKKK